MDLSALLEAIDEAARLPDLRSRIAAAAGPLTLGVADGAKAAVLATLARDASRPIIVITARPQQADALADELRAWLGEGAGRRVLLFPQRDALPYERLAPDPDDVRARLDAVAALAAGEGTPIVVACAAAVSQRTITPDELARASTTIRLGERVRLVELLHSLDDAGYRLAPEVTAPGEIARRGGIIDLWPPSEDAPVRVELFGDQVESLRAFDPVTQRSRQRRDELVLRPAREWLPDAARARALAGRLQVSAMPRGAARDRWERDVAALREGRSFAGDDTFAPFLAAGGLLDHAAGALVVLDEPADISAVQRERDEQADEARRDLELRGELPHGMPPPYIGRPELDAALQSHMPRLHLSRWAVGDGDGTAEAGSGAVRLRFGPAASYGGRLKVLAEELTQALRRGQQVVVVSTQSRRLAQLLEEHDVFARETDAPPTPELGRGALTVVHGALPHGWTVGEEGRGLTLLTDAEVFGFSKQRRPPPRRGPRSAFLADLVPGEYVVHIEHGIARFAGLVRRESDGVEREYLELQYAEGDRLFVPTEQVDRISRYIGPSEHRPSLTRLGTQEWARAKARVRRAVAELAKDLLRLYAAREVAQGHAFPPDTAWQTELEASFPFVETPDQQAAIRDVKRDMESPRPMDRLVCGDVGYGKTEVAVRAAFKAVLDGRQVAVLVPTTVLAQQHFATFRERLAGFPVRIEMLSRFRSDRDQRRIVADAAAGALDIVIGTHRLLQKDVSFKDLGLVIIDEEQRFGVAHKERLKLMRAEVDVLTLTATPIPRTLNMALSGIRDMSTIETPPEERLPIKTYVTEFDDHLVREAVMRELERGGQVYFVHNRVHNIELVARKLRDLVPEARILIGHGQMPEDQLEQVMLDFTAGAADVLVCTTIIESGLDIPNVNTIIINNADRFGLAQLYQLRGRVGRGAVRAYAYLLYEKHRALSEVAQKRLQTIFEATELGAGFQIALRDLEIRGAGNLLGAEQSGQIGAVGFDLYVKLLGDAVAALRAAQRGEPPPPAAAPPLTLDLPLTAYIPETYVADLNLRLALYQRMAAPLRADDAATARPGERADELERELLDRFGPPPAPVRNLLYSVRVRELAERAGVVSVSREDGAGGRMMLVVRAAPGRDFRDMAPRARHELDRSGIVSVGHNQVRIDVAAAGGRWRELLVDVLEAAAGTVLAA